MRNVKLYKILLVSLFIAELFVFTGCQSKTGQEAEEKEKEYIEGEEISDIYLDPDAYAGKYVSLAGKIYDVSPRKGDKTLFFMSEDPAHSKNDTVVVAKNDLFKDLKEGDYIEVAGQIEGGYEESYFEGETPFLEITADKIEESSFIEAFAPTIQEIKVDETLEEGTKGVSVTLQKIELAKEETRVYLKVNNQSKKMYYFSDSKIVQNSKQLSSVWNDATIDDPDYKPIESAIPSGVIEEGVVVFKPVKSSDFQVVSSGGIGDVDSEDVYTFEVKLDE